MVSDDKLIKTGIKYTDSLFKELAERLARGVRFSDSLEEFLQLTQGYTSANPLTTTGFDETMIRLILSETNNHRFSRPSQKELVRLTLEQYIGDLIRNVGEDIKEDVRGIVKDGYNQGLNQEEIAENITRKVESIGKTRANAIARTEIARTATVSDYIINKERGATHFTVDCRNTACPICKEEYLKDPERKANGRGMTGDVEFSINQTDKLPPLHPNCRCVVRYSRKGRDVEELRSHIHIRDTS